LFVTYRTFNAIQNSADSHKQLHSFYPTSTILMLTCCLLCHDPQNIWM